MSNTDFAPPLQELAKTTPVAVTVASGGAANLISHTQITSTVTVSATTEGTATTVITAPAYSSDGVATILIEFFSTGIFVAGGGATTVTVLYEDGSSIGLLEFRTIAGTAALYAARRLVPAAGSRTYSIRGYRSVADGQVSAGPGGSGQNMPAWLRLSKDSS